MSIPIPSEFDFIVVGGGTAGNVVAGRLAENPTVSILIVEAGIANPQDVEAITTPSSAFSLRGGKHDWGYKTTMIARPDYERVEKPNTRGKALGGSSCLNYYTWVPGSSATFDDWAEFGGSDWTWKNVKEYLAKPVNYHDDEGLYSSDLRKVGRNGPLDVSHSRLVPEMKPFRDALSTAWVSKGEKLSEDIYSGTMHGLVHCMNTIYNGLRSTSGCFVRGKPNVTILASTNSKQINFDGTTATGVTVLVNGFSEVTFKAKREVIVSQGVFETPKLLMLSGIGPRDQLAAHGINPILVSEHVGQNLLDHPIMPYVRRLKDSLGFEDHLIRPGPARDGAIAAYRKDRTGPASSGLLELVGFPRIDSYLANSKEYVEFKKNNDGVDPFGPGGQPHFEIDFVPMFSDAFQWHIPTPATGNYVTVIVDLLRPLSRNGWVKLNSTDPLEQPHINLNFFSHDLDLVAMREGCRMVDDILTTGDGMKDIIGEDYPWPMPRNSDEAMKKAILERSQTGFHPCGTCRLSKSIEQGVVDPELRVHGIQNLRVIDASVIPIIPDCRIQNSVYMIGEKGADMIKSAHPDLYSIQP
ncbi:glucose-methanol-choline oxidoreductase-like protein [Corynespora cassiicola Philippines]|uniref:Glucose-methanol-choline oxidoreductase-like protein n=1 Tax=Corynespora cassiicola Philippines TaxID=1448308 RepID=A0A2T2NFB5_CORCC|nr:glucose-methanol-choline oxidoreductase-like protein [Corynespora cassiicola Philippines]